MSLKFGSWHHRASSRRENTGLCKTWIRTGGCGRRMADGGWRMADGGGGFKKKKEEEEEEIGC